MRSLEIPQQPVNWMGKEGGKEVEYFFFSPQFQHCPSHTNHKATWDSKLTLRKIQSTQSWLAVLAGILQMRSIQALMITKCWRLACSTRRLAKFVICLMMSIPLTCTGFQRLEAPRSKQDRMCLLWLLQMVSKMNTNSQVFLVSQNSDIIIIFFSHPTNYAWVSWSSLHAHNAPLIILTFFFHLNQPWHGSLMVDTE